jgi:hypothetical protein
MSVPGTCHCKWWRISDLVSWLCTRAILEGWPKQANPVAKDSIGEDFRTAVWEAGQLGILSVSISETKEKGRGHFGPDLLAPGGPGVIIYCVQWERRDWSWGRGRGKSSVGRAGRAGSGITGCQCCDPSLPRSNPGGLVPWLGVVLWGDQGHVGEFWEELI